jgi:NAD(P)-dependent dehydrogenase (short-subunit alcohol dehydrogenase family)
MGMLNEKVAIVTGATSGIGERTADLFVSEGATVLFTERRKAEGEAVARRLGKSASDMPADATSEADWQRVISFAMDRYGRIDALFNNAAGPAPTGGIEDISVDGFDSAMALLVRSVMLGMKHVAPIMKRQRSGSIIKMVRSPRTQRGIQVQWFTAQQRPPWYISLAVWGWNWASMESVSTPYHPAPLPRVFLPRHSACRTLARPMPLLIG